MRVLRIFQIGALGVLFAGVAWAQDAPRVGVQSIVRTPRLDARFVQIGRNAAPRTRPSGRLNAYGTDSISFVQQSGESFISADPVVYSWSDLGLISLSFGRFSTDGGFALVGPSPQIPGGANLIYVELDFCDTSDVGDVTLELVECDYLGACNPMPVVSLASTGSGGCDYVFADLTAPSFGTAPGLTIDNLNNHLVPIVFTTAGDATTSLTGVIYGYQLQLSPPPMTPTFNDVPDTDFGYQYIEALAASGITGGCGGGNYCPDGPVTRRQMAIFIAKALGLSWSGY